MQWKYLKSIHYSDLLYVWERKNHRQSCVSHVSEKLISYVQDPSTAGENNGICEIWNTIFINILISHSVGSQLEYHGKFLLLFLSVCPDDYWNDALKKSTAVILAPPSFV
jgi:hypothetical protein